jgi:hypothetical protein
MVRFDNIGWRVANEIAASRYGFPKLIRAVAGGAVDRYSNDRDVSIHKSF